MTCNSEIEKKQVNVVRDDSLGGSDCEMVEFKIQMEAAVINSLGKSLDFRRAGFFPI